MTCAGIDVAKYHLDLAVRTDETTRTERFDNGAEGIDRLTEHVLEAAPKRVVLEASGGYERPLAAALAGAGLPVAVVNPRQTRDYARATGRLAKTDEIDAGILALFADLMQSTWGLLAERMRPDVRPPAAADQRVLSALTARSGPVISIHGVRRRQLIGMRTAEQNRLETAPSDAVRSDIEAHLRFIDQRLEETERRLEEAVEESPMWREKEQLLCSVPGVGKTTARTLLADLPHHRCFLGQANRQEIAKLVHGPHDQDGIHGVAPLNQDSGQRRGRRRTWGGRASVRASLYMAALVATRCNGKIRRFYHRLLESGKAKKVALVACMRKLLVIMNTMVQNGTVWNPDLHPTST